MPRPQYGCVPSAGCSFARRVRLGVVAGGTSSNTAPSTVTRLPRNVGAVSAAPTAAGDDRAAHHFLREFARPILLLPDLSAALICLLRRGRSRSTRPDYRWPPVKAPSRRLGRPMMRAAQSNQRINAHDGFHARNPAGTCRAVLGTQPQSPVSSRRWHGKSRRRQFTSRRRHATAFNRAASRTRRRFGGSPAGAQHLHGICSVL